MATKVKIILAKDLLEVTPDGIINIATSRQLLVDIAKAGHYPVDYELLVDFRDTEGLLSTTDLYQLASELSNYGDTFRRKVALLVTPGINFSQASFLKHSRIIEVFRLMPLQTTKRRYAGFSHR